MLIMYIGEGLVEGKTNMYLNTELYEAGDSNDGHQENMVPETSRNGGEFDGFHEDCMVSYPVFTSRDDFSLIRTSQRASFE